MSPFPMVTCCTFCPCCFHLRQLERNQPHYRAGDLCAQPHTGSLRQSRHTIRRHKLGFGLGDTKPDFLHWPAAASGFIWGVGPLDHPTATSREIGSGKLSLGPTAVALATRKLWVIGMLGRQLWYVAAPVGPSLSGARLGK